MATPQTRFDFRSAATTLGIALAAYVLVLLFFTPRYALWYGLYIPPAQHSPEVLRATFALQQLQNPFVRIDDIGNSVLNWRVFFPIVGHLLHLPAGLFLAIPQVGCLAMLVYTAQISRRYFHGHASVFCATALAATASWFFISNGWLSYPDSWCMLGLLIVCFGSSRTALVTAGLIEPFIDERFVLMIPLALAVRFVNARGDARVDAESRRAMIADSAIVIGVGALYIALRLVTLMHDSLSTGYIFRRASEINPSVPWTRYALGAWMGLRVMWVPVAAAIWLAFGQRGRLAGAVLATAVALSFLPNLSVAGDLSRSMGTFLPVALLGLFMLQRRSPRLMSIGLPALLLANLLLPAWNVVTTFVEPNQRVFEAVNDYLHPPAVVNAQIYYQSGKAALDAGEPADAVRLLNWSIQLHPNSASALIYRSMAKAKLGDFAGADADQRAATKMSLALP